MDVFTLLERLEELVAGATRVPLTGKVLLDPDAVLALIDELREALPEAIRAAGRVQQERDRILQAAREEAEAIVRDAKAFAAQLTDEQAVAREAQQKAEEMIEQAKRVAREIRAGALAYADELLGRVEQELRQAYEKIARDRAELRG